MADLAGKARLPWRWILPVAAAPAVLAVAQLGRIHPDEVYQTLEPAYFRAFGYGIVAWEWHTGLRNWAIPMLFSWLLRAAAWLGVSHPVGYRALLELPQLLLHVWMLVAVYRYAERRVEARWAVWAVPLVGLFAPVITFAGRTMGESFSTAFLVVALEKLDRHPARLRSALMGGVALGLAVVARYASAVVVAAAMLWLLPARRAKTFLFAALGGLLVAAGLGALDWATWGKPFHSFLAYLDFNVLSGQAAAQFGEAERSFYLLPLATLAPLWAWPGLFHSSWKMRPAVSLPLFSAAAYVLTLSLTAHKELRFLYPGLVLLAVAAAPGALDALSRLRVDLRGALLSLALCLSAGPFFLEGGLSVQRPDQFRAIVRASRGDDVTGLVIVGDGLWGVGGSFYVGKNIPWFTCDFAHDPMFRGAMADRRFNRAVSYEGRTLAELQAAGFTVVEQIGRASILKR